MNTKLCYKYVDASNYKTYHEIVFSGEVNESMITPFLHEGDFFIPSELGLQNLQHDNWGMDDHPWHMIHSVQYTDEPATVKLDALTLIARMKEASLKNWNEHEVLKKHGILY